MEITKEWLKEKTACESGIDWFCNTFKNGTTEKELIEKLIKAENIDWAWWYLRKVLTKEQSVKIAIYAAEQVIGIFEKKYPKDDRSRKAIEVAKAYLKNPCNAYAAAAADAAYTATDAAYTAHAAHATAYAAYAAYTAAYAAHAAANAAAHAAANAAANAAAYAAHAAAHAAGAAADAAYAAAYDVNAALYAADAAAYAAADAKNKLRKDILLYALKLRGGK